MKKLLFLILFSNSLLGFGQLPPSLDPHWVINWQDDFNAIDPAKWTVNDWVNGGWVDGESKGLSLLQASNVNCVSGNLVITTKNNEVFCPPNAPYVHSTITGNCLQGTYSFNSGWIESRQPYNTKFGYIEARMKIDHFYGMFPGFWTFIGEGVNGSNNAEIDIFEILGDFDVHSIQTNVHKGSGTNDDVPIKYTSDNFLFTDWHTYGLEWTPENIIWYLDDYVIRTMPNPGIIDFSRVIFNGSVAVEQWRRPSTTVPFDKKMYVDYVKVYKRNNDCNADLNVCNYNFLNYDNKVRKNITIGNGTCTNALPIGHNTILRSNVSIFLNNNFEAPLGSELFFDVNECY